MAAAYDLQYAGSGDGMKDVAYFLCSSVQRGVVDRHEADLLLHYHGVLTDRLPASAAAAYPLALAKERFEVALLDYCRWMAGWGWWGNVSWAQRKARSALKDLLPRLAAARTGSM